MTLRLPLPYIEKAMNNLVICGTIGIDSIETPFGKKETILGGSGTYASYAASYFTKPGLVSIVGKDLPENYFNDLKSKKVDLEGLSYGKKTFRWSGFYEYDMNEAQTLKTQLNALEEFKPSLPESYRKAKYLFLANIDPSLQLDILKKLPKRVFTLIDTMNFWIENKKRELLKVLKLANVVLFNDAEARQLFDTPNLVCAANAALKLGPKYVIIKKGEHGALLFTKKSHFSAPGYPLELVKDPTGAGDSFAGGLIGYLSKCGKTDEKAIRKGVVYGSAIASFCAENFGTSYRDKIDLKNIRERYKKFKEIRKF